MLVIASTKRSTPSLSWVPNPSSMMSVGSAAPERAASKRERGDAQGEVDAERFAAAVHLVVAGAEFVANANVERLDLRFARAGLALSGEGQLDAAIGHLLEHRVGDPFDFGE